jgi:hypothetical protein
MWLRTVSVLKWRSSAICLVECPRRCALFVGASLKDPKDADDTLTG